MDMIAWAAWIGVALVALIVLGFCAYEIVGKSRRLRREMRRLEAATARLQTLRDDLVAAQQRAAGTGL